MSPEQDSEADGTPALDPGEFDEEFLQDFFGELDDSLESLRETAEDILQNGNDESSLNRVFRRVHSIKSALRMVFLNELADYTHEFENLLSVIREGSIQAPPAFFAMLHVVMTEIAELAKTSIRGGGIDEAFMVLLAGIDRLDMRDTPSLTASSLHVIHELQPDDELGYIARLTA